MSSPQRFGRYVVQRRLGAGAFATVFLAYDDQLDSPVAVKVLADNWAGDLHVRERFLAEGRLLRMVDSPHVVSVHDAGESADGRPFLVMTFADAGTLVEQLQAGAPGSLGEAIEMVRQVGLGLSALHRNGIVHRDVKPANVLFRSSPDGVRAMVGDLGLGKVMDASSKLTQIGGTPAYAAPEQARGERITAAADQYALGALAYQLLEGRPAFSYESLLAAQRPTDPHPLVAVNRQMASVVLRALAPAPADRWPTVAQFCDALEAATPVFDGLDRTAVLNAVPERTLLASRFVDPGHGLEQRARPNGNPESSGRPTIVAPTGSPQAVAQPPRRVLWPLVAAVLAVAGLGAAGFAGGRMLAADDSSSTAPVVLRDARKQLQVTVPGSWVGVVAADGWTPPGQDRRMPGLSVGAAAGWQQSGSAAPGAFLGMLPGSDVTDDLPGHPECAAHTATQVEPDRRTAVYTKCPGGVLVEQVRQVDLHRFLWVQVRATTEEDATKVVDSVEVS